MQRKTAREVLKTIRDLIGAQTDRDLSDYLGKASSTVAGMKQRDSIPYDEVMDMIIKHGWDVNSVFFHVGDRNLPTGHANIPLYSAIASAGFGSEVNSEAVEGYLTVPKSILMPHYTVPDKLGAIRVTGDSMSPELLPGDTLLIDRDKTNPRDGSLALIRISNELLVKRVQRLPNGINLLSTNPLYPPVTLSASDSFEVIAEVVATLSWSA
jgi:SOS-response transcriptional repressor LexA